MKRIILKYPVEQKTDESKYSIEFVKCFSFSLVHRVHEELTSDIG